MLPADRADRRSALPPAARRAPGEVLGRRPGNRPAEPGPHPVELAGLLHELTAQLLAAADVQDAVDRLAAFARQALPAVARCCVALVGEGLPSTRAAAGDDIGGLDDPAHADGPAPDAIRTRELVTTPDLGADPRWPALAAAAPAAGLSVASVPLDVRRQSVGALTLLVPGRDRLEPGLLVTAMALAGQAEVLLGEVLRRGALAQQTAGLITSLRAGAGLDHAVGVIVAQRGCGLPEAYAFLHETARRLGLAPDAVAGKIVDAAARR